MEKKFYETENLKTKIPFNLQFFADDGERGEQGNEPTEDSEPALSAEEQLQQLRVEMAKLKRAQERAASEAADYKKKYNATLTEAEQKKQEEAEKEAEKEELINQLKRENAVNKLTKNFLSLGYTAEMAEKAATAQYDNDTDTLFKIQNDHQSALVKEKEAEWLKSRPKVQTGSDEGGTDITKEQFNRMGYAQRVEFKNKYPEAYKSFTT